MKLISDKALESLKSVGDVKDCVYSGLVKLDEALQGFRPAHLYIIGGRSSIGKTSLILDISLNVSEKTPVMFFSLEMDFRRLQLRSLCNVANANHHKIRTGNISTEERELLNDAVKSLKNRKIIVDDYTTSIYPEDYADRYKRPIPEKSINHRIEEAIKFGCKLIVIDYLQLIRLGAKTEAEYLRLHEITWQLHTIAKRFKIPIILACQLARFEDNRWEDNKDPRPRLDDLKGSGDIENDADTVLLLHRPRYYSKREEIDLFSDEIENDSEIIIAKNRDGPTGTINVGFYPSRMSWRNLCISKGDNW